LPKIQHNMKKQHLFFTAFMTLTILTSAQITIPNGGFENWTNAGSSTAQPTNLNSNKTGGGFASSGPQTCFRDTSTLGGGQYCTKIVTGSYFGTIVNGSCATGEIQAPSTNKADGYIETIAGDASHSAPFIGRPDSLVFWYRFTPGSGGDTPSVQARLHVGNAYAPETPSNSNHPDSTVNIIARAIWSPTGATVAGWTRVSIPFVYVDGRTPQYILITMTSSGDALHGVSGSTLWVDEMQAIYNSGAPAVASFTNQLTNCGNAVFINTSTNAASYTWNFSQLSGGSFDTTINNVDTVTIPSALTINNKFLICITARNTVDTAQTCDTVQFICAGINEISASDFNLYPNPASKVLNIQASQIMSAVSVVDEMGRIVAEAGDINNLHYQLNTSRISSGIYFVHIYNVQGQISAVRKVVIE
jgi:hypothetical protein